MRFFPVLLLVALFASAFGFVPKAPLMQKAAVAPRGKEKVLIDYYYLGIWTIQAVCTRRSIWSGPPGSQSAHRSLHSSIRTRHLM